MTNSLMDDKSRDLILAAEITGLLHDLGKLRREFAEEGLKGGKNLSNAVKPLGISAAHGAILETDGRAYPPAESDAWLEQIKNHDGWKKILELPTDWIQPNTVQAYGLGDALRQHHATGKFPESELTLLGDIYTVGADWRDSALDKGSGGTKSGKQKLQTAFIADSFGNEEKKYVPASLETLWQQAQEVINNTLLNTKACDQVVKTRQQFLDQIELIFWEALGETRRPTNDVTLWHHCFAAASLFKAALAECVLRQQLDYLQDKDGLLDFSKLWHIRFRLLGIRWDWAGLTQGALKPVVFTALTTQRDEAIENLRQLLEIDNPIGNIVYEDDDGIILAVPGFYEGFGKEQASEDLFSQKIIKPLESKILNALIPLGVGAAVRLAWTKPRLYLTDYAEVIPTNSQGERERILQVGERELQGLWKQATIGQVQICPQCGLRPSKTRELSLNESILDKQQLCDYCEDLLIESTERQHQTINHFYWTPKTFNLQKIRKKRNQKNPDNPRVALLSVRIDAEEIANGMALLTQIARPANNLETLFKGERINWKNFCKDLLATENNQFGQNFLTFLEKNGKRTEQKTLLTTSSTATKKEQKAVKKVFIEFLTSPHFRSPIGMGEFLEEIIECLKTKQHLEARKEIAQTYLGDQYWLGKQDGRIDKGDTSTNALELIEEFFLRECVPPSLSRHTGDKLAIFGMRKHASPGRLARIWDDLYQLWQEILEEIGTNITERYAIPLSLDAQGFRVIVAAEDAREALIYINEKIKERLGKVRAGFNPHVSAIVFKDKFPLYVAFDAIRRMEKRITELPAQNWKLLKKESLNSNFLRLTWEIPSGKQITWTMNLNTGDPQQEDLWYPHVICTSRDKGPGRIVHVKNLKEGERIELRPATFDFAVLEGTARRYQLAYHNKTGCRDHFILGKSSRPPYLLEQMSEIMDLVPETLEDWDATRRKGIYGQVVECYEKWVRDVPEELQEQGRQAWHTHVNAILLRYLHKDVQYKRDEILGMLDDGRFFDAFEWAEFVEKSAFSQSQ